jgi:NTP pyrophosphatase (non-canonical NTP hydrolase)
MLNELCKRARDIAVAHGFTDATPAEDIALMHSELSEALEDIRAGLPLGQMHYEPKSPLSKPCGVPSEMADVVIRVFHFCGKHEIDLDKAVQEKMAYNDSRPFKHGGKRL